MSVWPVAPQIGQESDHGHGVLSAGRPLARSQAGGHQGMRGTLENEEGQIAIALVVMVIEGTRLLTMRWVIGVIQVEHKSRGWFRVAGAELLHQGPRQAIDVLAVYAVFQTREGGATRQVLLWLQGWPLDSKLDQGGVPQTMGIIAVRIPRGNLVDTLGKEGTEAMVDKDGCRLSCTAAARRWVRPIWRSIPRSKRAPKSDDKAPPSKSARPGYPTMGGKRRGSGVECSISKPLGVFTE